MLPDRVANPGPLTYESGALPIALRGPARRVKTKQLKSAWCFDGTVLIKHLDDSVQKITCENDLPVYVSLDPRGQDMS